MHLDLIEHANYINNLEENRKILKKVVTKLEPFLARQKVAFWGGGRIFDALVRYGGLDPKKLLCVIDKYLWPIVPEVHGIKIHRPEYLKMAQPDVIVILARSSLEEIAREIRLFGFRRTVIPFTDLLQEARGSTK